jgi:hypothetical protein
LISETTIINRCRKEHSYECRLKNGTLPWKCYCRTAFGRTARSFLGPCP